MSERLRVVLLAEGSGDTGGPERRLPASCKPLREDMLGPAHFLVRRALMEAKEIASETIQFEVPLRAVRTRWARGSDLLNQTTLRKLLVWPIPKNKPHLAVVLVDADGDNQRRANLEQVTRTVSVPAVVAVAVQELEAWLIADHDVVGRVLGIPVQPVGDLEDLDPRDAKERLAEWMGRVPDCDGSEVRRTVARECDLALVRDRCPAFARFVSELRQVP